MANAYEQYKQDFLKNNLYEKVKISKKEYDSLENKDNTIIELNDVTSDNIYFRAVPIELSDEEQNNFIFMKMFNNTKFLNEKISTMKNIMVFWLILTILSVIGSIYSAVKMAEVFSRLG